METTTTVTEPTLSTPERHASQEFDPRAALDFDNVTQLRGLQTHLYDQAFTHNKSQGDSDELAQYYASKAVETGVEDYLIQHGLAFTTRAEFKKYKQALMDVSILNFDNSNWKVSYDKNEDGTLVQSGRERVIELYEDLTEQPYYPSRIDTETTDYNSDTTKSETEPTEPVSNEESEAKAETGTDTTTEASSNHTTESSTEASSGEETDTSAETDPYQKELSAEKEHLETLRSEVAKLSAVRQGRVLDFGKNKEAYEDTIIDYNAQVVKYGKLSHKDLIENDSIDEVEKNKQIVKYLFAEQNALREASVNELKGTKLHKFLTGFAKVMDHEKRSVRILKSVALGAGVGIAATAVGGVVAGGAAVAGAGVLGVKFARAFAQREAKVGRGMELLKEEDEKKALQTIKDPIEILNISKPRSSYTPSGFDQLSDRFNDWFETDTKNEQANRRKSVVVAMGTVAAGLIIGHTLANMLGDIDVNGKAPEAEITADPDTDPGTDGGTPDTDTNTDIDSNPDTGPDTTQETDTETTPPEPEFVPDPHFNVPYGKGGIWLFQEMGLTEADWYSVHQELLHNFPNEFYNEGGDVRFTHAGQLSEGVQNFVKSRFNMP